MNKLLASFIVFASEASSPFDSESFLKKIFPNFWDFVVQLIAFIILLIIVIFIGYKPIKKLLDERKKYVEDNLNGSLKARQEAEEAAKNADKTIAEGKAKALSIVEEAKVEANKEREKIINSAKEDAKNEKIKANEDIELAKKAAKESIHKEIVDVALKASSQVLSREVNSKDNEKLIDDFISNIEDKD